MALEDVFIGEVEFVDALWDLAYWYEFAAVYVADLVFVWFPYVDEVHVNP